MGLLMSRSFHQFSLRTLLLLVTLAALLTLPVWHFARNRWRYSSYERPDVVREHSLEWMRQNSPSANQTQPMHSQESDLPSP